jgi:hypothetical protein
MRREGFGEGEIGKGEFEDFLKPNLRNKKIRFHSDTCS